MRKILVFTVLFLCFIVDVNALITYSSYNKGNDPNDDLVYNVESVEINSDKVTFNGWAIVNRKHTIGGKNYRISIIAYKKSNFENGTLSNGYTISETSYSGENRLFPSLCFKDGNGNCMQVYYGFSRINNFPHKEYASCEDKLVDKDEKTACIHYDPNFSVSFNFDTLVKELNLVDGDDGVVFVIKIEYKDVKNINGSGCLFNSVNYVGCSGSGNKKTVSRTLAFDDSVVKNFGGELGTIVEKNFDTKFVNRTYPGGLYKWNEAEQNFTWRDDFSIYKKDASYNIIGSEFYPSAGGGLGMNSKDIKIRWYALDVNANNCESVGEYNICIPNGGNSNVQYNKNTQYFAPATWGIVDGYVVLSIKNPPKPPVTSCNILNNAQDCDIRYSRFCDINISDDITDKINLNRVDDNYVNKILNVNGCNDKASISVERVYKVEESYNLNISDIFKTSKPWPGLSLDNEYKFTLERESGDITNYTFDTYYKVTRHYKDSNGVCQSESGYATKNYLLGKGFSAQDLSYFELKSDDYDNKNNYTYEYIIPNSNDVDKIYNHNSGIMNAIKNEENNNYIDFSIKNAYIDRISSNVKYSDSVVSNSLKGGKKYYIPLNAKNGKVLTFRNEFKDVGLIKSISLEQLDLTSTCTIVVKDGNLETMKYRVIDIDKPFPNNVPTLDGYASNWYNIWDKYKINNDKFDYLRTRYNDKGIEYDVDLSQTNIQKIRKHNDNLFDNSGGKHNDYLYINANLDNSGDSNFINDYLGKYGKNINVDNLGKSGVDW